MKLNFKSLTLMSLVIFFAQQSSFAQDSSSAQEYWDRAVNAFNSRYYEEAAEYFGKVLEIYPEDTGALENRARSYALLQKFDESLADFDRVIELKPKDPRLYSMRGSIFKEQGICQKALADFEKSCSLGNSADCSEKCEPTKRLMEEALANYENENYQEAIALFTQIINFDPKNEDAWYYRAQSFRFSKKYPEALRDITKAINIDQNDKDNWYARAHIYEEMKQNDKAVYDYSQALSFAVSFGQLSGDYDKAISILTDRAILYQKMGQCNKSYADLKQACLLRGSRYSPCDIAWCGENISTQKNLEALIVKTANKLKKTKPYFAALEAKLAQEFNRAGQVNQKKMQDFIKNKQDNYQVYIYRYAGLIEVYGSRYPADVPRVVRNTKWY